MREGEDMLDVSRFLSNLLDFIRIGVGHIYHKLIFFILSERIEGLYML